ncbi:MAG: ABC transporter permease, partial [Candidatus Izemoplasmatales bacterium]|nr:ABC transporter permease [Candidatus Izemoplasmatales bacterium]
MKRLRRFQVPYLVWMGVLIIIPTFVLILLAFSTLELYNIGPFKFTLSNFSILIAKQVYTALWNSLKLSVITTVICFIIGYPVAFYLSTLPSKPRKILMSLLIIPLWSNMLLRIVAWEKVFTPNSYFTDITGLSFNLLGSQTAIVIGMVAMYLPFMIFPIFSVLEKLDKKLLEASQDLGATDSQTFFKVIFPLSSGGVVSGVIMTMLPSMTSFVLPARLGLGNFPLIGNIIESKFMKEVLGSSGISINEGSLISLFIMILSIVAFIM